MADQAKSMSSRPRAFKSIDIYHEEGEDTFFEIVLGTLDGQIFHAALDYSNGSIEVVEPFTFMLELIDAKAILDIKIASISFS